VRNAADVYELFQKLGYDLDSPEPFESADLDAFEFDPVECSRHSARVHRQWL